MFGCPRRTEIWVPLPAPNRTANGVASSSGRPNWSWKNCLARSRSLTATVETTIASASMHSPRHGSDHYGSAMDGVSDPQDDAFGPLVDEAIDNLPEEF